MAISETDKQIEELHRELDSTLNAAAEPLSAFGDGAKVISTFKARMLIAEYFIKGLELGKRKNV